MIKDQVISWTKNNLDANFIFRPNQLETIVSIIDRIVNNKESNHIIEAPTGSGKSVIILISAGVLSTYYNKKSYILCSDLSLWKQYYVFIKNNKLDYGYLKGQLSNYECNLNHTSVRCADCKIMGKSWTYLMSKQNVDFPCAEKCSYIRDRKRACLKDVTLMTYQCYLYSLMHQEKNDISTKAVLTLTPREVMFCDECHHMPDVVMPLFSPHIYSTDIETADKAYTFLEKETEKKLNKSSNVFKNNLISLAKKLQDTSLSNEENLTLLKQYNEEVSYLWNLIKEQQDEYSEKYKHLPKTEQLKINKIYKVFENFVIYGDQFRDLLKYLDSAEFLVKEVNGEFVDFYNLKQDFLVYKALLNKSKHRVMLSATVGDIKVFNDNIGIKYLDDTNYQFSRVPSTFDFSKSPIIIYDKYKLNYYNKEKLFPKIKELVYNICDEFKDDKGIIQTTSYTDAKAIYDSAPVHIQNRLLVYNNSSEKEKILQKHMLKPKSILLGPTLNEGLDLPDDLCRFIILTKVPYPQLNNEFTKRKMELFKGWYQSTASLTTIQSIGRGVRNEKDYCKTFILDGCFFDLFFKTKDQYAPELQNRFIVETK